MSLILVSDLHLNPTSPERNQQFLHFLSDAKEQNHQIIILGDLFDLWFGWPDLQFEFQAPILLQMKELVADGLILDYVEGNRDFGIKRYAGTIFRSVFEDGCELQWGGWQIYLEHGDRINRDDLPYRTFRKLSKNAFTFFLLDHLPSAFLLKSAERLEKKLKGTNLRYKQNYPELHCKRFREQRFQLGSEIVVVGHFHQERKVESSQNSKTVLFYNLPGWEEGFRYLVIPEKPGLPFFQDWSEGHGNLKKT
jgi:UDP-2,3-diacylglucosamine hydrolase